MFFNAPPYTGPKSDHFDGRHFHNTAPIEHGKASAFLKWMTSRERRAGEGWTRIDPPPGPKPEARVFGDTLRVTLVGHATLLIQMQGLNVLTDPLWEPRTSPVRFAGPKRFRPAAIRFDDLPPIDLVLVSHNHYDHLSVSTLKRIADAHDTPTIVTGLGNRQLLEKHDIGGAIELDWWASTRVNDVTVTAVEMQHFSGRGPRDRDVTLWVGLVVEHPLAGRLLFCGDTGYGAHFARIRERIGAPRVALVPIGAYQPRALMKPVHVDPTEAVQAHLDLGAQTSVGMHYGTFRLTDEPMDEPPAKLVEARAAAGLAEDAFRILPHGVSADLP